MTEQAGPRKKPGWKRWARPVMMALAFVFVALTGVDLARRWRSGGPIEFDLLLAIAAMLPVLAGNLAQGVGWILLVERMAERRVPRLAAMALYLDSQLVRYAPGKLGLALVRMEGAHRLGLLPGLVGVSVFIEALSWLATGAIVGLGTLLAIGAPSEGLGKLAGPWLLPLLCAALFGGLLLVAVDRRRVPQSVLARVKLEGRGPLVPFRLPLVQAAYWASWVVHGYVLARAFGASSDDALGVMGFVPVASVLGMVALAAPAGVGVREAALIYGLGPVLGGPGALAFAVSSRIGSLACDLVVWASVRALSRRASAHGPGDLSR